MPITDFLERNAREFGDDIALVEVNPERKESRRVTWREYELIESTSPSYYRNEISWHVFDEKANRFANLLLSRGVKRGDKVAILLMNHMSIFTETQHFIVLTGINEETVWSGCRFISVS